MFGLDDKNNVYTVKVVKQELIGNRDLLLLGTNGKTHYVYIKDFEKPR